MSRYEMSYFCSFWQFWFHSTAADLQATLIHRIRRADTIKIPRPLQQLRVRLTFFKVGRNLRITDFTTLELFLNW